MTDLTELERSFHSLHQVGRIPHHEAVLGGDTSDVNDPLDPRGIELHGLHLLFGSKRSDSVKVWGVGLEEVAEDESLNHGDALACADSKELAHLVFSESTEEHSDGVREVEERARVIASEVVPGRVEAERRTCCGFDRVHAAS